MEPDVETRRKILEAKLAQHQVKGYEYSVNAKISEVLGELSGVKESTEDSSKHYRAAKEIERLISELPRNDVPDIEAAG